MNDRRFILTLKYTAVMSAVLLCSLVIIYVTSDRARHNSFRNTLRSEAITKANLYLENKVDAQTMQHIYLNNTQFINEVEVAVYTRDFEMLYHDAAHHDIVKETPEMIADIVSNGELDIPVSSGYQAVGLLYMNQFVVTAAAHDGHGEANMASLRHTLLLIFIISILLMLAVGYYLANMSIRPIERALASQKMFVSNVSHELRTPLAAIMGELGLALQKERTPADYQQRIERALDDTNRMSEIVIGLLNMARAEYDASQIRMETVRVDELLMDVRDALLRAKPDYHVSISFAHEPQSEEDVCVNANRYLMALAFRNLIENNCKFSADHQSVVSIRTGERLEVSFTDNGIGMTVEEQKHMFQMFYRGSSASRQMAASSSGSERGSGSERAFGAGDSGGHGIGMPMVQRILSLHGAEITVHSKEGHGTSFVVRF